MRFIQRISAWLGWAMLLGVGVLLVLEGAAVIGASWREWIADAAEWMTRPSLDGRLAALIGVVLGLVALVILIAQFVPVRMTGASSIVSGDGSGGSTRVTPTVIRRAAISRLKEVEGVADAAALAHKKRRLSLRARLERDADASRVEQEARTALGDEFWGMLGVPPTRIDLTLAYTPQH